MSGKRSRRVVTDKVHAQAPKHVSVWQSVARHWRGACLLAWVALIYAPSLANGFVYDDDSVIREASELMNHPSLISQFFSAEYFRLSRESTYRPFVTLSYMLDWHIAGPFPWAFHLQNLLWHLVAVGALLLLLKRLGASPFVRYASAAIYGVHPLLTEAVDSIGFREDVLVTSLGLVGLLFLVSEHPKRRIPYLILGNACLVAAMLSKESAVVFVLLLPLTHWAIARRQAPDQTWRLTRHLGEYVILSICTLAYLGVRFLALPSAANYASRIGGSVAHSIATGVMAFGYYLRLFVYPYALCADYRGVVASVTSGLDWRFLVSAVVIVTLTALAWLRRVQHPLAAWGWAWFLIGLGPVSNVVPIPTFMAERFLHLPLVGLVVFFVALVTSWARGARGAHYLHRIVVVVVIVLSGLTWMRQGAWFSNETLWATTLRDHPSAYGALHGYGTALIEAKRPTEAIPYLERALATEGIGRARQSLLLLDIGVARASLDQLDGAIAAFQESLAAAPRAQAYSNLGIVFYRRGRFDDAADQWRAALRLEPHMAEAHSSLGAVLARQGKLVDAIAEYREAVRLDPDMASAHANLGMALTTERHLDEAIEEFLKAVALQPGEARWRYTLATVFIERGRTDAAIEQLEAVVGIDPAFGEARDTLERLRRR